CMLLSHIPMLSLILFFLFIDTSPSYIYTLSLHDALPIFIAISFVLILIQSFIFLRKRSILTMMNDSAQTEMTKSKITVFEDISGDRKSTRLNSSHVSISYAVFCLKKKKKTTKKNETQ